MRILIRILAYFVNVVGLAIMFLPLIFAKGDSLKKWTQQLSELSGIFLVYYILVVVFSYRIKDEKLLALSSLGVGVALLKYFSQ